MLQRGLRRIDSLFSRIRMRPFLHTQRPRRMRGVLEHVVLRVHAPFFDLADLLTDGDHGSAEAIQLHLPFALGGFDHQGSRYRPGHRWRMEAVIDQALGYVVHLDPSARLQRPHIEDALMCYETVLSLVEHGEVFVQAKGYVVCVQDRDFAREREATGSHHRDVGPRDRKDRWTSPRGRRYRANRPDC